MLDLSKCKSISDVELTMGKLQVGDLIWFSPELYDHLIEKYGMSPDEIDWKVINSELVTIVQMEDQAKVYLPVTIEFVNGQQAKIWFGVANRARALYLWVQWAMNNGVVLNLYGGNKYGERGQDLL